MVAVNSIMVKPDCDLEWTVANDTVVDDLVHCGADDLANDNTTAKDEAATVCAYH